MSVKVLTCGKHEEISCLEEMECVLIDELNSSCSNHAGSGGYTPLGQMVNGGSQRPGGHHQGGLVPGRAPLVGYPGGPHMQPYAIPSRGGVHGPIGGIPQIPQSGSRGFGAGRGISTGGPIGGHLSHHQASQQHAGLGTSFGFGGLDNLATQPSVAGLLTQQGSVTQAHS